MTTQLFKLQWVGSFQATQNAFAAENPLEEAWAQIARMGTDAWLQRMKPDNATIPWADHLAFVKVRIQQAVEFWKAAHSSTLLTAPLPLYYAFLSLMRAYMALVPEVMPRPAHGLKFVSRADILSCGAALNSGTFTHYLETRGIQWKHGDEITLHEALGCIVELFVDVRIHDLKLPHVQFVNVTAYRSGEVTLAFPDYPRDFATSWTIDFPSLVPVCTQQGSEKVLVVQRAAVGDSYESISKFLDHYLLNHLTLTQPEGPRLWWALRASEQSVPLDRVGYYHVAAFILASAVRYEPELILAISGTDSAIGWLLKRLLERAGRFYPQLVLSTSWKQQVYF